MSHFSDTELVALLMTQRLVDAGAPPLKGAEFWSLVDSVADLGAFLGAGPEEVGQMANIDQSTATRIVTLLGAATSFAFALDDAQQGGLTVLSALSRYFPARLRERLGRAAPPLLYALGDIDLLAGDRLGIVGSRAVSESGADVAREAAVIAVKSGFGVTSGGAKGVDLLAMNAALDAGGAVVGVLAGSLLRTARGPEVRRAISDGLVCLCSPYKPSAGFTVANAMGRNKLIYAMSNATLVVECDQGSGGTWAGAVEALRARKVPVIAWTGADASPGNLALIRRGAHPLEQVDRLFPLPDLDTPPSSTQGVLDL